MADEKLTTLAAITAPDDADLIYSVQGVSTTPVGKKATWTVVKAFLKTYFDTLYRDKTSNNILGISFDVATTQNGQSKNRTSAGTYTAHRAYISINQPIKLHQVKWDVSSAKTYNLKIYRGYQYATPLAFLGDQVTAGRTADVTWDAGDIFLFSGPYTFELTWDIAAVVDDNNVNSLNAFSFFGIDKTQYNTTFDSSYSAALSLVAYLGTISVV